MIPGSAFQLRKNFLIVSRHIFETPASQLLAVSGSPQMSAGLLEIEILEDIDMKRFAAMALASALLLGALTLDAPAEARRKNKWKKWQRQYMTQNYFNQANSCGANPALMNNLNFNPYLNTNANWNSAYANPYYANPYYSNAYYGNYGNPLLNNSGSLLQQLRWKLGI